MQRLLWEPYNVDENDGNHGDDDDEDDDEGNDNEGNDDDNDDGDVWQIGGDMDWLRI